MMFTAPRRNFKLLRQYADSVIYYLERFDSLRVSQPDVARKALLNAAHFSDEAFRYVRVERARRARQHSPNCGCYICT